MKALTRSLALIALLAGPAGAQTNVPAGALVAEGEARWEDALRLYRAQLEREPAAVEPWLRIADIETRLGRASESIAALEHAAAARPGDDIISSRLSQAYAAQGHAMAALHAIEAALAVQPLSDEDLRAHATLATWAGNYDAAARSYRKLRQAHPQETDLALALARVSVWNGSSDAAASAYRDYLKGSNPLPEAWLELGTDRVVARQRHRCTRCAGAVPPPVRGDGRVPPRARLCAGPQRTSSRGTSRSHAAAGGRTERLRAPTVQDRRARLPAKTRCGSIESGRESTLSSRTTRDTRAAESLVRSMLGSNVGPATTFYNDSDGLQVLKAATALRFGLQERHAAPRRV